MSAAGSECQPSCDDLVTTLRDMRTPLAVAAADLIEELESDLNAMADCYAARAALEAKP